MDLCDATLFFNLRGEPVQLDGLGTYTPTIDLTGEIGVGHRADNYLKGHLNDANAFKGDITRRENIGKSSDDLVTLWNAEHPDDPVA